MGKTISFQKRKKCSNPKCNKLSDFFSWWKKKAYNQLQFCEKCGSPMKEEDKICTGDHYGSEKIAPVDAKGCPGCGCYDKALVKKPKPCHGCKRHIPANKKFCSFCGKPNPNL
jgi:hypothetical protein